MIADIETLTDAESLSRYGKDWTKHFNPKPEAVMFPRSTEQVQTLVQWARKNKKSLVPSGGRTGLSAGAYATAGEIVVSFEKMNRILEFDPVDQTVRCEAGVVTETLQKFAWEKGYYYPVDFGARGSSQIGGNVATNAGGIKVIRYGLTRQWVAGLTVVTGAGEILRLNNSLVKNATGYDLRQLIVGSEGTLALVTEVTVNVTRQPKELVAFLMGTDSLDSIMEIYRHYQSRFTVMAYEMFTDLALEYVTAGGRLLRPLASSSKYYVLLELERESDSYIDEATELFADLLEKGLIKDGTMSQSPKQANEFWRLREDITEATSHKSPYKNDISVRVAKVPEFLREMTSIIAREHPDFEVVWFGHIGDGNLHVNILKPDSMSSDDFVQRCHRVDEVMFKMIEKFEGSVSAEHGVGLVKKPFLHHTRSPQEIALMRSIKKVFDPDGILNPGKIFD